LRKPKNEGVSMESTTPRKTADCGPMA